MGRYVVGNVHIPGSESKVARVDSEILEPLQGMRERGEDWRSWNLNAKLESANSVLKIQQPPQYQQLILIVQHIDMMFQWDKMTKPNRFLKYRNTGGRRNKDEITWTLVLELATLVPMMPRADHAFTSTSGKLWSMALHPPLPAAWCIHKSLPSFLSMIWTHKFKQYTTFTNASTANQYWSRKSPGFSVSRIQPVHESGGQFLLGLHLRSRYSTTTSLSLWAQQLLDVRIFSRIWLHSYW